MTSCVKGFIQVFVYGTLKRNCPNNYLLKDPNKGIAKYVCSATTKDKYPLVVTSDYNIPFLLNKPGVGNHVSVEVYDVDQKMKDTLDELESLGVLYDLVTLDLITENSNEIHCPGYLINNCRDYMLELPMISSYWDNEDCRYVPPHKRTGARIALAKQVRMVSA